MGVGRVYDIRLLDELAANARPGRVQQALEGWRLRAADGITRRANSVLTNAQMPKQADWLEVVENFYRRQRLPARYQISPASPLALDSLLEQRGYGVSAPTSVMVGAVEGMIERAGPPLDIELEIEEPVTDEWIGEFLMVEGFPETQGPAYRLAFSSIGPRAGFALAKVGADAVGVGIAVAERGWVGLFSIATKATFQRLGIGTEIVRALGVWSRDAGAEMAYLQVVAENSPAVRLYEKLGFETIYAYHYREKVLD